MIDLHIHTLHSDGAYSAKKILELANSKKLDVISITDHDSVSAYDNITTKDVADFNGKIITGCEFTTSFNNQPIEVLGYNIDLEKVKSWLNNYHSPEVVLGLKKKYLASLKEKCVKHNIKFDADIEIKDIKDSYGRNLFKSIIEHDENKKIFKVNSNWFSYNYFYRKMITNSNHFLFIDFMCDLPTLDDVVNIIHSTGGKAFLAHLFAYGIESPKLFLDEIVKGSNLDGLECFHSINTLEQSNYLLEYCQKNNLSMSGGSDFHGTAEKATIKLGSGIENNVRVLIRLLNTWS